MNRISFASDYTHSAHPAVLAAITADGASGRAHPGYGLDTECAAAADAIRDRAAAPGADVHFLVGGTQANATLIGTLLRPWQAAIAADTGHIAEHETGAIERTGNKVEVLPGADGKITAAQIAAFVAAHRGSGIPEHMPDPRLVHLSHPTELGTLYTLRELEDIAAVCRDLGLLLMVDGARLAYGLTAPGTDVTLADLARLADVVSIGGTKCGALFGEAVLLPRGEALLPALDVRAAMKQSGALLAKGWLLGVQFRALFDGGRYERLGAEAVAQAQRIADAARAAGLEEAAHSPTNQRFVLLSPAQAAWLDARYVTTPFGLARDGSGRRIVRFVTSWATREEDIDALVADLAAIASV